MSPICTSVPLQTALQLVFVALLCLSLFSSLGRGSACTSVKLADDRLHHLLQLLLLCLEVLQLSLLVRLHPLNLLLYCFLNGFLVLGRQLAAQLLLVADLVLERVGVAFKLVTGINALLQLLVLVGEALSVVDHALNVLRRQTVLVVGDGDLVLVARSLVLCCDTQDAVDVNLEGDLDLGHTTRCGGDASQVEGSQQVVVFGQGTLT
ncbi:hypothetical protein J4Q44_G00240820, partial [Coregonus suidteri]